jgi:DNA-binding NtrC family response regulator
MPGSSGLDLLKRIREVSTVPVILVSASGDVSAAVAAIKAGAEEFFRFPTDRERVIDRARALAGKARGASQLARRIVGESPSIRCVRDRVRALAPLQVPVLVSGEAGSGRDHVVHCLAELSERGPIRLQKVPADAEHGPRRLEPGVAYYLDAIDCFTPSGQARWLELICESESRSTGIRVFASTSADLAVLAAEGNFISELAERLLCFEIPLAPLRERRGDIEALVRHFSATNAMRLGRAHVRVEPDAMAALRSQPWAANVRELAHVMEKLVAFSPEGDITAPRVREVLGELRGSVATLRQQRELRRRDELVETLEACGGNIAEVARQLDLSRGAVIYRAQKFGLLPKPVQTARD